MGNQTYTGPVPHSAAPGGTAREAEAIRAPAEGGYRGADIAAELLTRLFRNLPGTLALRLWNGADLCIGKAGPDRREPRYALVFRNPGVVCSMVLGRDPLRLAEAYFRGDMDIEGDFFAALSLKDHLQSIRISPRDRLGAVIAALRLRALNPAGRGAASRGDSQLGLGHSVKAHSKADNSEAIRFHYDVSNEFYALWLDRAMVYSCAYFEDKGKDLDQAQQAKLGYICRKLRLAPGDRFLDIGCGWGALVIYAAQHYGVRAHGITLSRQQLELAQQRINLAGLQDRVTVELKDYRDLADDGLYDKVASIGMFEHVGLKNLPLYFSTVHRLLKPAGLFLNHGITHESEGWSRNLSTEFINRYVFPDGELDTVSNIQRVMEQSRFEIADVEALRPHYALTLRRWVERLERGHARALQSVAESTYRVWRLYMAACALEFESGGIGIYQVLASKRAAGNPSLPLTRRALYCAEGSVSR